MYTKVFILGTDVYKDFHCGYRYIQRFSSWGIDIYKGFLSWVPMYTKVLILVTNVYKGFHPGSDV